MRQWHSSIIAKKFSIDPLKKIENNYRLILTLLVKLHFIAPDSELHHHIFFFFYSVCVCGF